MLIAFYTDFFYNVIIAWSLYFFFASFTRGKINECLRLCLAVEIWNSLHFWNKPIVSVSFEKNPSFPDLPWTTCNNTWNTPQCYDSHMRDAELTNRRYFDNGHVNRTYKATYKTVQVISLSFEERNFLLQTEISFESPLHADLCEFVLIFRSLGCGITRRSQEGSWNLVQRLECVGVEENISSFRVLRVRYFAPWWHGSDRTSWSTARCRSHHSLSFQAADAGNSRKRRCRKYWHDQMGTCFMSACCVSYLLLQFVERDFYIRKSKLWDVHCHTHKKLI